MIPDSYKKNVFGDESCPPQTMEHSSFLQFYILKLVSKNENIQNYRHGAVFTKTELYSLKSKRCAVIS